MLLRKEAIPGTERLFDAQPITRMKRVRCSLDLKQQPPSFSPKTSIIDQQTFPLVNNAEPQPFAISSYPGEWKKYTYAIFIHVTAAAKSNYSIAGDASDCLTRCYLRFNRVFQERPPFSVFSNYMTLCVVQVFAKCCMDLRNSLSGLFYG